MLINVFLFLYYKLCRDDNADVVLNSWNNEQFESDEVFYIFYIILQK